ncbi:hypothetical protein [Bradyrhizobium sp. STM 3557]|uniref:hypothetical protein n=1 Tax=Bradyrhizobium sp. STM 3557 TaxID=578920 RepID=UPI00388F0FDC
MPVVKVETREVSSYTGRMNKRIRPTHCYLCGEKLVEPTSVDHVPPLLFFPKEMRRRYNISNLLTIPVHAACNREWQEDEEYFVHTLLPMTGGSEAGDAHHIRIREKIKAGKNVFLVNQVMDEFKSVIKGVHLPANRVAKFIDHHRAYGVIWKIIRGLYFHHHGVILPKEWGMRYWITAPYEPPEPFFKDYADSGRGVSRGEYPKIFSYFFDRFQPDGWDFHYWGFHLWDSLIVTAMFHDPWRCGCPVCQFVGPVFPESMEGTVRA